MLRKSLGEQEDKRDRMIISKNQFGFAFSRSTMVDLPQMLLFNWTTNEKIQRKEVLRPQVTIMFNFQEKKRNIYNYIDVIMDIYQALMLELLGVCQMGFLQLQPGGLHKKLALSPYIFTLVLDEITYYFQ